MEHVKSLRWRYCIFINVPTHTAELRDVSKLFSNGFGCTTQCYLFFFVAFFAFFLFLIYIVATWIVLPKTHEDYGLIQHMIIIVRWLYLISGTFLVDSDINCGFQFTDAESIRALAWVISLRECALPEIQREKYIYF